jgi:hypothetical protein
MVQIVVTPEQARQIEQSRGSIEIVDQRGNRIGCYTQPFTNAEIAEAKRRSRTESGGRTTKEILDRISRLESK